MERERLSMQIDEHFKVHVKAVKFAITFVVCVIVLFVFLG